MKGLILKEEHIKAVHHLKILPEHFKNVLTGVKTFEIRKNDRGFSVNDLLILKEWNEGKGEFTGREQQREVSYILEDEEYVKKGYVILAFKY